MDYSKNGGSSYTTYFYATNAQGDVEGLFRIILNTTSNKYEQLWYGRYTYDAWGKVTATTASGGTPSATSVIVRNPIRYRGYVYDNETGWYYLQSRYYDPANHRFINADSFASTGQGFVGTNMFAYCLNNPVNMGDEAGTDSNVKTKAKNEMVTTALMLLGVALLGYAFVRKTSDKTITKDTPIEEALSFKLERRHTVYVLFDPSDDSIQYVGRTTNVSARRTAHSRSENRGHLEFKIIATGLNYYEARGLEQTLMVYCGTRDLEKVIGGKTVGNAINGISPNNPWYEKYISSATEIYRISLKYVENVASNEYLNWKEYLGQ